MKPILLRLVIAKAPMWKGVSDLSIELKKCEDVGSTTGALAMAFICLDTLAFLAMEEDKPEQTKRGRFARVPKPREA